MRLPPSLASNKTFPSPSVSEEVLLLSSNKVLLFSVRGGLRAKTGLSSLFSSNMVIVTAVSESQYSHHCLEVKKIFLSSAGVSGDLVGNLDLSLPDNSELA